MTIVDDQGRRMRLWFTNEVPEIKDPEAFMEMLVDRTVKILNTEPVNVYVSPTFLPAAIAADYDRLWTEERMQKVVAVASRRPIAIEINSRLRLPRVPFSNWPKPLDASSFSAPTMPVAISGDWTIPARWSGNWACAGRTPGFRISGVNG
jgi:hypothetical protein